MKNYCKYCGERLVSGQEHECSKLPIWEKIKSLFRKMVNHLNYERGDETGIDYYERNKAIIPESIEMDDGEVAVKQYDLAVLRTRHKLTRAEGRMQITNKRIVFRATGRSPVGKTVYQSEFAMDKIDGIEIRRDYRFLLWDFFVNSFLSSWVFALGVLIGTGMSEGNNTLPIIIALLMALATSIPFFALRKRYLLKLLVLSLGSGITVTIMALAIEHDRNVLVVVAIILWLYLVALFCISMFMSFFKPNLVVEVKTSSGSPGVQIKHRFASFFIWKKMEENSGFSEILPGKEADIAIKEIGAMINDIKTLGDFGIVKWKG